MVAALWLHAAWYVHYKFLPHKELAAGLSLLVAQAMDQPHPHQTSGHRRVRAPRPKPPSVDPFVVQGAVHYGWSTLNVLGALWLIWSGLAAIAAFRRAIGFMRAAAWIIILCTGLTIFGIEALIRWGGFPPDVSPLVYLILIVAQSSWGLIMLANLPKREPPGLL